MKIGNEVALVAKIWKPTTLAKRYDNRQKSLRKELVENKRIVQGRLED
jgi:hypothetical protein